MSGAEVALNDAKRLQHVVCGRVVCVTAAVEYRRLVSAQQSRDSTDIKL